jgi:Holliday junction resolvase-like predicted endonuclease
VNKLELERIGIDFVCSKLIESGHTIVFTHHHIKQYEIDIVTDFQSQRIFHEVRTTHSTDIERVISAYKILRICSASELSGDNIAVQFHVVRLSAVNKVVEYQQLTPSELL